MDYEGIRSELHLLVDKLECDELPVVAELLKRIDAGRYQYGALDLSTDPRDWSDQAHEELLDWCVYRNIKRVAVRRLEAKL